MLVPPSPSSHSGAVQLVQLETAPFSLVAGTFKVLFDLNTRDHAPNDLLTHPYGAWSLTRAGKAVLLLEVLGGDFFHFL